MKSFSTLIVAGPLLALFWECSAVADYSIDWYVVSGGGGVSTGGVYQVSGTIGQPAADAMSAGRYSLQGGFWGLIAAVQTPGAPLLQISVTASNSVLLQFTAQANAGYVIEYRESLSSGAWQTLSSWTLFQRITRSRLQMRSWRAASRAFIASGKVRRVTSSKSSRAAEDSPTPRPEGVLWAAGRLTSVQPGGD